MSGELLARAAVLIAVATLGCGENAPQSAWTALPALEGATIELRIEVPPGDSGHESAESFELEGATVRLGQPAVFSLANAFSEGDSYGDLILIIELAGSEVARLAEWTADSVSQSIAILSGNKILMRADVMEPMLDGQFAARGYTSQQVRALLTLLRKDDAHTIQHETRPVSRSYPGGERMFEGFLKNGLREGAWAEWHLNGNKQYEGGYANGEKHGRWVHWYANGTKWREVNYVDGREDGLMSFWYPNGGKSMISIYVDGEQEKFVHWDESGAVLQGELWE